MIVVLIEEVAVMELIHPRCAGIDVSKRDAKVCVRIAGGGRAGTTSTVTTWGSVINQVLALREHLIATRITLAVMEATGDYWKPFYYLLEDAPFGVILVNARHVKNLPGPKTDVSDAAWLAEVRHCIRRARLGADAASNGPRSAPAAVSTNSVT